ncbi:MAG: 16S rRNA (guanine(527)-N(7))-methyltransferase RsmG [Anaerolineales bacterium]|nr:16S rRNA (guanine(527)-N(7))-methyltransferase RsmG [Chloroflexota bacterium]MBL6979703.1 16S rRNA (guanine(527)-N(7))-methyltransferase RsmG [Anaerolineales bacterium]
MQKLAQELEAVVGVTLNPQQVAALEIYAQELIDWNARYSLTAIDDPGKVRVKHFLDSLSAYMAMRNTPVERVIDVGTGAGFPGLPLKILCPHIKITLVESVTKKVKFCEHIVEKLALEDVVIVRERVEVLGKDEIFREKYDWAVARAVALMPILMEFLLPLVRVGGRVLAMKGESAPAEAHTADRAIGMLGGNLQRLIPVTLPGVVEQRYLVVVDKVATTPEKFPRRVGIPAKRPL